MNELLRVSLIDSKSNSPSRTEEDFEISQEILLPFSGSKILFAKTSSGEEIVIKISNSKNGAYREWMGLVKTYDTGLPVPTPILYGSDPNGSKLIVSDRVKGTHLYQEEKQGARQELGKILRGMHERVEVDGKEWAESGRSDFGYYDRYTFSWLNSKSDVIGQGSMTDALLSQFADEMNNHCVKTNPVFNHNDLHDGQVIIREDSSVVIIDFENWREESPFNDIAFYLFHSIRVNSPNENFYEFLNGYTGSNKLDESSKSVLAYYLLFISARTVNYFSTKSSPYLEKALATHKEVLNYIDNENLWINL